jgi:hypothetical protein
MKWLPTIAACLIGVVNVRADKPVFLFVQVADSGTLVPKEGAPGHYLLTLEGISPQTVYFSDHPVRDIGHVSTDSFLKGLGFSDKNPPNGAIEAGENTIVVELRRPVYNIAKSTLQYDVSILPDAKGGLAFYAARRTGKLPKEFSTVSLFIDDCANATITCIPKNGHVQSCGTYQVEQTWATNSTLQGMVGRCTISRMDLQALCSQQLTQCCPYRTVTYQQCSGDCTWTYGDSCRPVVSNQPGGVPQRTIATTTFAVNSQTSITGTFRIGDIVTCIGKMVGNTPTALAIMKK